MPPESAFTYGLINTQRSALSWPHVKAGTPAQTEDREWAPGNKPARKKRKKSGRQPLEVDGSRRQIGLDLHVGEAAPDGAREPVPSLGFAMKALLSPAVTLVEPPILFGPSFGTATSPQQSPYSHG